MRLNIHLDYQIRIYMEFIKILIWLKMSIDLGFASKAITRSNDADHRCMYDKTKFLYVATLLFFDI